MMRVNVYSTTTCPFCQNLKDYLDEKGIAYVEKMVDSDEAAKAEMLAESDGFMGVPFAIITKDDGTKEKIIGFDRGKLDQILGN